MTDTETRLSRRLRARGRRGPAARATGRSRGPLSRLLERADAPERERRSLLSRIEERWGQDVVPAHRFEPSIGLVRQRAMFGLGAFSGDGVSWLTPSVSTPDEDEALGLGESTQRVVRGWSTKPSPARVASRRRPVHRAMTRTHRTSRRDGKAMRALRALVASRPTGSATRQVSSWIAQLEQLPAEEREQLAAEQLTRLGGLAGTLARAAEPEASRRGASQRAMRRARRALTPPVRRRPPPTEPSRERVRQQPRARARSSRSARTPSASRGSPSERGDPGGGSDGEPPGATPQGTWESEAVETSASMPAFLVDTDSGSDGPLLRAAARSAGLSTLAGERARARREPSLSLVPRPVARRRERSPRMRRGAGFTSSMALARPAPRPEEEATSPEEAVRRAVASGEARPRPDTTGPSAVRRTDRGDLSRIARRTTPSESPSARRAARAESLHAAPGLPDSQAVTARTGATRTWRASAPGTVWAQPPGPADVGAEASDETVGTTSPRRTPARSTRPRGPSASSHVSEARRSAPTAPSTTSRTPAAAATTSSARTAAARPSRRSRAPQDTVARALARGAAPTQGPQARVTSSPVPRPGAPSARRRRGLDGALQRTAAEPMRHPGPVGPLAAATGAVAGRAAVAMPRTGPTSTPSSAVALPGDAVVRDRGEATLRPLPTTDGRGTLPRATTQTPEPSVEAGEGPPSVDGPSPRRTPGASATPGRSTASRGPRTSAPIPASDRVAVPRRDRVDPEAQATPPARGVDRPRAGATLAAAVARGTALSDAPRPSAPEGAAESGATTRRGRPVRVDVVQRAARRGDAGPVTTLSLSGGAPEGEQVATMRSRILQVAGRVPEAAIRELVRRRRVRIAADGTVLRPSADASSETDATTSGAGAMTATVQRATRLQPRRAPGSPVAPGPWRDSRPGTPQAPSSSEAGSPVAAATSRTTTPRVSVARAARRVDTVPLTGLAARVLSGDTSALQHGGRVRDALGGTDGAAAGTARPAPPRVVRRADLAYLGPEASPGAGSAGTRTVPEDLDAATVNDADRRAPGGAVSRLPSRRPGPGSAREPARRRAIRRTGPDGVLPRAEGAGEDEADATPGLLDTARGQGLLHALSRASRPEQVAEVLVRRHQEAGELASELPEPAARLVREITAMRTLPEGAASMLNAPRAEAEDEVPLGARRRRRRRGARRMRHLSGPTGPGASGRDGAGSSRLMKLSEKLMGLIHLAEVERRQDEAARQVRRSDEKVDGPDGSAETSVAAGEGVTLASLQREVLEAVQRELEMMRGRREGGPDVDFWW